MATHLDAIPTEERDESNYLLFIFFFIFFSNIHNLFLIDALHYILINYLFNLFYLTFIEVTKILTSARQKYLKLFPSMSIKIAAISCRGEKKDYIGFDSFRERLEEFSVSQSHMGQHLPLRHLLLEQIIKEERFHYYPPIIDKGTYMRLARSCNFDNEMAISQVTRVLHDLGVLVYFENDPLLSNFIIINPNFITELLCTLITTKHTYVQFIKLF